MSARVQRAAPSLPDHERDRLRALDEDVERAIRDLPSAQVQALRLRFGVGARAHSRRAVARHLGLRTSQVHRLERIALRTLRVLALPRDVPRPGVARTRHLAPTNRNTAMSPVHDCAPA